VGRRDRPERAAQLGTGGEGRGHAEYLGGAD
jgi:hypothetical protein